MFEIKKDSLLTNREHSYYLDSNETQSFSADPSQLQVIGDQIAPRDVIEKKVADIWADVLHIDREMIGIHTNFFDLGGHTVNTAMVFSKIKQLFNIHIPLIEIYKTPTVLQLTQYIKRAIREENSSTNENFTLFKPE
jgi:acyl carrier protein